MYVYVYMVYVYFVVPTSEVYGCGTTSEWSWVSIGMGLEGLVFLYTCQVRSDGTMSP